MYRDSDLKIVTVEHESQIAIEYRPWGKGEQNFYAVTHQESIAGLMLAMNTRAYIYSDTCLRYGKKILSADDIAYDIMGYINAHYANKRGKRPSVSVDIIDSDTGEMVKRHTIVGVKQ